MTWPVTFLRRVFVGASVAWFGALPLATFASSRPSLSSAMYLFAFVTYLVGGLLCHQRPERSFFLWGSQMPVCARCTGIYFGAALAAITWSARRGGPVYPAFARPRTLRATARLAEAPKARRRPPRAHTGVGPYNARGWLNVAVVPTIVTLIYEWTTGRMPLNWIRAVAGLPIGIVVAWIVLCLRPERPRG
jgi:uncharacterized membrane protein